MSLIDRSRMDESVRILVSEELEYKIPKTLSRSTRYSSCSFVVNNNPTCDFPLGKGMRAS